MFLQIFSFGKLSPSLPLFFMVWSSLPNDQAYSSVLFVTFSISLCLNTRIMIKLYLPWFNHHGLVCTFYGTSCFEQPFHHSDWAVAHHLTGNGIIHTKTQKYYHIHTMDLSYSLRFWRNLDVFKYLGNLERWIMKNHGEKTTQLELVKMCADKLWEDRILRIVSLALTSLSLHSFIIFNSYFIKHL